jgi:hypothetical protein
MFLPGYVDANNNFGVPASFVDAAVATENQCDYHYSD